MIVRYYSSVGGGVFGKYLVDGLSNEGIDCTSIHELDVIEYWENKKSKNQRSLRFRTYVVYPLKVIWDIFTNRCDIRVITSNPFYLPVIVLLFNIPRKTKLIFLLYDLYPETLLITKKIQEKSFVCKITKIFNKIISKFFDGIVFLGNNLQKYFQDKYGIPRNSNVIHVGGDSELFKDRVIDEKIVKLHILYNGHMGMLHDHRTLCMSIEIIQKLVEQNKLVLTIAGSGPGIENIKNYKKNNEIIKFKNNLNISDWKSLLYTSHVAIITMTEGSENVLMPSKFYNSLLSGLAVIAICPIESDLAKLTLELDCGWVVEPGNTVKLSTLIKDLIDNPSLVSEKMKNAYTKSHIMFDNKILAKQWKEMLEKL